MNPHELKRLLLMHFLPALLLLLPGQAGFGDVDCSCYPVGPCSNTGHLGNDCAVSGSNNVDCYMSACDAAGEFSVICGEASGYTVGGPCAR